MPHCSTSLNIQTGACLSLSPEGHPGLPRRHQYLHVLDHIKSFVDNVITHKRIRIFPDQKHWMNSAVHILLKAQDTAFKSGDVEAYSTGRTNLKRGIRSAKHEHKLKSKENFHNSYDQKRVRASKPSDYKSHNAAPTNRDASL